MRRLALLALFLGCAPRPTTPSSASAPALATDLHVHLAMDDALKPFFQGEAGSGPLASSPDTIWWNQVDGPTLSAAGVRVLLGSGWPAFNVRPGRTKRDEALHQLDALRAFTERHPEFEIAGSSAEARRITQGRRIAVIPIIEGGEGIQQPEDVDLYFARGARALTLVHLADCDLGGAAKGQIARTLGCGASGLNPRGLSALGRQVVERMFQLGMVIDLAHASDHTADDVLTLAEAHGVPVINSHAGSRDYLDIERNLSDALAKRIVATGGMLGVTLFRDFAKEIPEADRWRGYVPRTCDDVVATWLHFARLTSPDVIALGSDFNGMVTRSKPGGSCPHGIRNSGDLPDLYQALREHGISAQSLDHGGDTLLRILEVVESRADPDARAEALHRRVPEADLFESAL